MSDAPPQPPSASAPPPAAAPPPPRRRRRLRILGITAGVLFLLFVLFVAFAVPAILSSDAAARTASDVLTQSLGRTTTVGDLEFGWSSGLEIRNVVVAGAPGFADRPFFKIAGFAVRPRVLSLFTGRFVIKEVTIDGPEIYVERHADGTMNLPALGGPPTPAPPPPGAPAPAPPAPAAGGALPIEIEVSRIALANARFTLNDVSLGKPLEIQGFGFDGRAEMLATRLRCEIAAIRGQVNGGSLAGAVTLQDGAEGSELKAEVKAQDVAMGLELTNLLKSFLPLLAGIPAGDAIQGKLRFELAAAGTGKSRDEMMQALGGKASLGIRDGAFGGSPMLRDLAGALQQPKLARYTFQDHTAAFTIRERRIYADSSEFTGDTRVSMKGWVDFAQQMDYRLTIDPKAFGGQPVVVKTLESVNAAGGLQVAGPVDHPKVELDVSKFVKEGVKAVVQEKAKEKIGEALKERGVEAPAGATPKEGIEKGVEGLLKRKKKP